MFMEIEEVKPAVMPTEHDKAQALEILKKNGLPLQFTDRYTATRNRMLQEDIAAALAKARTAEWQPIETAPKDILWGNGLQNFGPLILAFPVNGKVDTVEWWQSKRNPTACNFLDGGGNAAHPTHWMPLPDPPKAS